MKQLAKNERGHLLIGVLFLIALSLVTASGLLTSTSINIKTRSTVNKQTDYYYDAETVLNSVVAWLQDNSKELVYPFRSDQFGSNFDLGSPTVGDNEGDFFSTPTLVKMKGTNHSVILSTEDAFGESYFPATQNLDTGTSFDAVTEFRNANFGNSNARIVLVWARNTDGHYEPVYRVDVITGNNPDRGVHSFSYVYSSLVISNGGAGFYGEDFFSTGSPNNICSSYMYTLSGGTWSRGAARSNCSVASDQSLTLKSIINGSAATLLDDGIDYRPPSGSVTGEACDGAGCHGLSLTAFPTWTATCGAVNKGDVTISSNTTLTAVSDAPSDNCWRDVTVNNNKTLTLSSTDHVYHFRNLNIANNGSLRFPTITDPTKKITIFVESFSGGSFNGNQVFNTNNAPYQIVMNYTGSSSLRLNGTAMMAAYIRAPLAAIDILGNFNYYGSIHAKSLAIGGNATIGYDETGGSTPVLSDIRFGLRKASQRYR